jgi:hypothetical protein
MTTTPKEVRRAHSDTNMADYFPEHAVIDLDETYKPQDLLDALRDLRFRNGPKMQDRSRRAGLPRDGGIGLVRPRPQMRTQILFARAVAEAALIGTGADLSQPPKQVGKAERDLDHRHAGDHEGAIGNRLYQLHNLDPKS